MRDVSFKVTTLRTAKARAVLSALPTTIETVNSGGVPKGDPLQIAKAAAVTAAKKTTEWIPYCHNIPIEYVGVEFELNPSDISIDVTVKAVAKTGVEMEAMTAAWAAALTIYDMLKMLDDDMEIVSVRLLEKQGGKSDFAAPDSWTAGVIVISDRVAADEMEDVSGPVLVDGLFERGAAAVDKATFADMAPGVAEQILKWSGQGKDVILLTGGTGVGPRDATPELVLPMLKLRLQGVEEALRNYSQDRVRTAMFSRSVAGIVGTSIVIALPGSPAACQDALDALFPAILHAKGMIRGGSHP